jgi:hypothetical protein
MENSFSFLTSFDDLESILEKVTHNDNRQQQQEFLPNNYVNKSQR